VRRLTSAPAGSSSSGAGGESASASGGSSDPNVQRLQQELAEKLGAKVTIEHGTSGKGKVVVTYNSLDELDGILAHIQ
jgi:ParB family chromosome partitioning protein